VIVLDNLSASESWNVPSLPNVQFVEGDILDEDKLRRVFFERPSTVFHLAASFANQKSVEDPATDLMANALGTLRMLQYSALSRVERFVYTSSGASCCGTACRLPLREEETAISSNTPYQITKMAGERYCDFFAQQHELPVVKVRLFGSYGPGDLPGRYRNVIPNFIYRGLKGEPLPITGSGRETRAFTFVEDVVDGLLRAATGDDIEGEVFNIASERETSVIELAETISELTDNQAGVMLDEARHWDKCARVQVSTEKARRALGYHAATELRDGLTRTVAWFIDQWDRIEAAVEANVDRHVPAHQHRVVEVKGKSLASPFAATRSLDIPGVSLGPADSRVR
jgi:nucleoside-diphosphate-sugar epimerase